MRPLTLTMTAFGPYADTQIVDFRSLNDRSFFLIHGSTGAGKTTILDAICFALYGETSGNERKSEQMRSHHAIPSVTTEVTFDFRLGSHKFRVTRSLKRDHSESNSTEIIYKPDKAILWQYSESRDGQIESTVLVSKWKKVTEKIVELLGFESNQFRQVILLPQDQFQKLLKATSQDREDIFKTLFQTERFERIEKALKDESRQLDGELQKSRQNRVFILNMAQVNTTAELIEKRQAVIDRLTRDRSMLSMFRSIEQMAQENLIQGQDIQKKIDERKNAAINLNKIESMQNEIEIKRQLMLRAQRAAGLLDLEKTYLQQLQDAEDLKIRSNTAQTNLEQARIAQQIAADILELEQSRNQERVAARQEQDQLKSIEGLVQDLETAQDELNRAQKQADLALQRQVDSYKQQEKLKNELHQLEQELTKVDASTRNFLLTQLARDQAQQVKDNWIKLGNISVKLKAAQLKEAKAFEQYQRTEIQLNQAREKRDHLEEIWHAGQASILAKQLVENDPCPVCGSTNHPQPAISDVIPPSESEIKKARTYMTELETEHQVAQNEWSQYHEATVLLDAEQKPLMELLGDKAHLNKSQIEAEFNSAQVGYQQAEAEDRRLSSIKQRYEPLKEQLSGVETNMSRVESMWQDASMQLTSAQAIFSERERGVPPNLRDKEKLLLAQKQANEKVLQLDQALQQAQMNDSNVKQQLVASETACKQILKQAEVAWQRSDEIRDQFMERIKAAGFLHLEDYNSAKLQPTKINLIDIELREYDGQLSAAREWVERATKTAESLVEPDIDKLKAEHQAARDNYEETLKTVNQLEVEEKNFDDFINQITQIQDEFDRLEKQYAIVGKIADVANGRNTYNLTFQRFVLSALLDDVLNDATQRLDTMSRGRYILQRSQSLLDKRKASGLDLVISDTWTGDSKRPVETLSGGEGFYTSLALALGLAEVVQRYAGGIRLDTIFIDEGFGSLDTDTLDLAIRTLEGLRENGRLVGIISHVESLCERIPTRLEVIASTKGSSIKLIGG